MAAFVSYGVLLDFPRGILNIYHMPFNTDKFAHLLTLSSISQRGCHLETRVSFALSLAVIWVPTMWTFRVYCPIYQVYCDIYYRTTLWTAMRGITSCPLCWVPGTHVRHYGNTMSQHLNCWRVKTDTRSQSSCVSEHTNNVDCWIIVFELISHQDWLSYQNRWSRVITIELEWRLYELELLVIKHGLRCCWHHSHERWRCSR